jgi:two-component system chemotaxis sensor kinase CheA
VSGLDPIETFRQEAQDLLEEIEQGLLDLAHRPGDRDLVDAVFRGLHTLKGSGAMFGFDALAAFTHHCETAFDRVRKGEVAATPELVGAVLAAQDHMRALAEGRPASEATGDALLADLRRVVEAAGQPAAAAPSEPGLNRWRVASACRPTPWSTAPARCPAGRAARAGRVQVVAVTDGVPASTPWSPPNATWPGT